MEKRKQHFGVLPDELIVVLIVTGQMLTMKSTTGNLLIVKNEH
jgi:hypothetical protein